MVQACSWGLGQCPWLFRWPQAGILHTTDTNLIIKEYFMNQDLNKERRSELLKYDTKTHLELLKDSQELEQQGKYLFQEFQIFLP